MQASALGTINVKVIRELLTQGIDDWETSMPKMAETNMSCVVRKPVFKDSNQVRHKPGCTTTEHGWRLKISKLGSREIILCCDKIGADQLRCYLTAGLCLCIYKKKVLS